MMKMDTPINEKPVTRAERDQLLRRLLVTVAQQDAVIIELRADLRHSARSEREASEQSFERLRRISSLEQTVFGWRLASVLGLIVIVALVAQLVLVPA